MAAVRRSATGAVLTLALLGAGCAPGGPGGRPDGLELSFEDATEPAVFSLEGEARRAGEDSADGLWAVVPGLPRPERAEVTNLDTRDSVEVALFRGGGIILSREAAAAIGLGDGSARVRIVALRREARIEAPETLFVPAPAPAPAATGEGEGAARSGGLFARLFGRADADIAPPEPRPGDRF